MHLSVIAGFGFDGIVPSEMLAAWAQCAGIRAAQAYRKPGVEFAPAELLGPAGAAGVTFDSLHAVYGPEYDLSSPEEATRRRSVDAYVREGEFAGAIGVESLVVHPSPRLESTEPPTRHAERRRQLAQSLDELSEAGAATGRTFMLENMPPGHAIGVDPAELARMIRGGQDRRGRVGLGLCFDVAHAFLAGDACAGLRSFGPLLHYVHASDNHGCNDDHVLPFDGAIDWVAVGRALREIGYAGPFMLEVFLTASEVRRRVTSEWVMKMHAALGISWR